ncbi:MAG TPA: hypothetical protein VKE94_09560 [Gemmataceae bacterium]|nr:hypothetical protein [Gemmataceae bacterium]
MRTGWQTSSAGLLSFALLLGALGLKPPDGCRSATEQAAYEPVASPAAIIGALRSHVEGVRDWVKQKDFASAAETIRGLATLADLAGYQSADATWRKGCGELQQAVTQLTDAARKKSAADCDKALTQCTTTLDALAKNPPPADAKPSHKSLKLTGSTKAWMLLMEWSHVDAKSAKSAKELDLAAQAIAEEVNAIAWLKSDAIWRTDSLSVRDAALKVAAQARADDFAGAKMGLKTVAQRCEACHDRTRKK